MTVAILGGLGLYINKGSNASTSLVGSAGSSSPSQSANMTSATTTNNNSSTSTSGQSYKDGTYTGSAAQTPYGTVQVAAVISGGKITNINFLQMPNDLGNSRAIAAAAEPLLKQTAIQKQSANIDFVSGATSDSNGFEQSLQAALNQAAI